MTTYQCLLAHPAHRRREKLRRIVRTSIELAIVLLLLWLLMDAISFHAALDELRRSVADQSNQISGLNHQMAGLTVKINGVVQQLNRQPIVAAAPAAEAPPIDFKPNWLPAAGLLGILARFVPILAL